jgi:hypothetical protein
MATAATVRELRRARRTRRLGQLEWFEIAYRVYLAALVGGVLVAWLSDLVKDEPVTASQLADVITYGPGVLGLFAAAAFALGLRSGSDGGPVSLEAGDVRHLMTAPVPRRAVLLTPVVQRCRAVAFGGLLVGGVAGQLAARRLPGSTPAWAASGAAAGALIGLLFAVTAVIAHALRMPRWSATGLAAVVVVAQIVAAAKGWYGPGNGLGSLAMWGMRTHLADLVSVVVVLALTATALWLADRLRLEPLTRRADLVSQLRFAVTMQDLRTVVLLRRQLRGEQPRITPWLRIPRRSSASATRAVWQRDLRGLARYPASRLVRMGTLAIVGGACAVIVDEGTTPLFLGIAVALYLLGLDGIEPMSQEIDHPDHADSVPRERGWLLLRHFAAPAVILVPFALLGAAVVAIVEPDHALAALALCIPMAWAGACGAVVSVVRDSPDPVTPSASTMAVPPEFAGFTSTLKLLIPLLSSVLAALTPLAMRESPTAGTAVRMTVLNALVIAVTGRWVVRREAWRQSWRNLLDQGQTARKAA